MKVLDRPLLSNSTKSGLTAKDVVQSLEDNSKILDANNIGALIKNLTTEDGKEQLIGDIIQNNSISNGRKFLFFLALHIALYDTELDYPEPYLVLATYYGLLNAQDGHTIDVMVARLIRKNFVNPMDLNTLDTRIMKELGQSPFFLTGALRTEIKNKIHVASQMYISRKKHKAAA